ncbi:TetR/AcrR family transcriptional regulator [Rhizobium ruizarguesonis]
MPALKRTRRTQAERSEDTRSRLCQATLDALHEGGYGKFSTEDVAKRANVSRGALTHQFPTRNSLIVAAFNYLVTSWESEWPFDGSADHDRLKIDVMVDVLWTKLFQSGNYIASLEMMLAARNDVELSTGIREVMRRWSAHRDGVIAKLLGLPIDHPRTRYFIQLNLCVMRGIAVHHSFDPDPAADIQLLKEWKDLALAFKTAGAKPPNAEPA